MMKADTVKKALATSSTAKAVPLLGKGKVRKL